MPDGVVLHCQAFKDLDWASLAQSWGTGDPSAVDVQAQHTAYVERFDAFRDPERGARIQSAIDAVGERANAGGPITWEGLCSIQAIVLGRESVGFREEPAYANSRMERYGFDPRLEPLLTKMIAKTDEGALHPLLKACRLYLDVRFFHPFAEGNGAAARLAFQWMLQREGGRVRELTPIFRLPLSPGKLEDYRSLFATAEAQL